jgi:hypothetical protein
LKIRPSRRTQGQPTKAPMTLRIQTPERTWITAAAWFPSSFLGWQSTGKASQRSDPFGETARPACCPQVRTVPCPKGDSGPVRFRQRHGFPDSRKNLLPGLSGVGHECNTRFRQRPPPPERPCPQT